MPSDLLLVARLHAARSKAMAVAQAEALGLLDGLGATTPDGGPCAGEKGVYWIGLNEDSLDAARQRFHRFGYTAQVELVRPGAGGRNAPRWKGSACALETLWREDPESLRDLAPDRRVFLMGDGAGNVRPVTGYRGDGSDGGRRGLPVADARALVNLSGVQAGGRMLDPFAGAGGVVLAGLEAGAEVASCDIDPVVMHGNRGHGAAHVVADASRLPFAEGSFDAVATEPPYHDAATAMICAALAEICRVLRPGGRCALLPAAGQAMALCEAARHLKLAPLLEERVNRKGTDVAALVWRKVA